MRQNSRTESSDTPISLAVEKVLSKELCHQRSKEPDLHANGATITIIPQI